MQGNKTGKREMKKIISLIALVVITVPAFGANSGSRARPSMATQMVMAAPRATASTNQISAMANANAVVNGNATVNMPSVRVPVGDEDGDNNDSDSSSDNDSVTQEYERQKQACLNNNIGIGNTFVWASRYSNTNNYATMVEDTANPENNVCFVLVEVKSADPKISVSDVPAKYFQMGQDITCGSWADEEVLRQRILDAKKTGRTWATVGGAVGGAGVGVGIMELFGNRLIGGAVMGQKALEGDAQLLAQLRALREQHPAEFDEFIDTLKTLREECENWPGDNRPAACDEYNYEYLMNANN